MQNSARELRDEVVRLITEDEYNRKFFVTQIDELMQTGTETGNFLSRLLVIFVHLEFDEEEAKLHWERIIVNCRQMSVALGRNVGLRVAILDYFMNINRLLNNPMLIEIHLFKQTERLAMTDGLTGLFNRRYFDVCLSKEMRRALRYRKDLSVAIFDLDDFKLLNDTKGHVFGDLVLKKFAELIGKSCREEDIACRYGGEEFVLILPEVSGPGTLTLLERIRTQIHSLPFFTEHAITFSAGIASYPAHYDGDEALGLVRSADRALYQAKFEGKDRIVEHFSEKRRHARFKHSWNISYEVISPEAAVGASSETITSQDVSLGGVRFESGEWLDLDAGLVVSLRHSDGSGEPLRVPGKVIWTRRLSPARLAYGIEFLEPSAEQKKTLSEYLPHNHFLAGLP